MKLVKESLNEVMHFERNNDPLVTLQIGKRVQIENWLKEHNFDLNRCKINNNFEIEVDINADVGMIIKYLKLRNIKIPNYIKFISPLKSNDELI